MPAESTGYDKNIEHNTGLKNPFVHIRKTVEQLLEDHVKDTRQKHYLLGVSGGPDSVLLAHVFHALGLKFSMAHVNYGLRGKESDADEAFVKKLAHELNVQCFVKKAVVLNKKGESLQMQARALRYAFFESLMQKEKCHVLVLAHQANDQVETLLLNLFRGCGIDGLTGMKVWDDKKFRPLLAINKNTVLDALHDKKIKYRTDSSNAKNDYKRNFLRNQVVPLLEKKWPGIEKTLLENIQRFTSAAKALEQKTNYHFGFDQNFVIDLHQLNTNAILANTFKKQAVKAGFKLDPLQKLLNNKTPGTKNLSGKTGRLEKKGQTLRFMVNHEQEELPALEIKGNQVSISIPQKHVLRSLNEEIDARSIKGPLKLRPWQTADRMIPLGMKGSRLISRMLTDLKLPLSEKKQVQVLCDNEKIVWLVGFRIDERVKLKDRKTSAQSLFLSVI